MLAASFDKSFFGTAKNASYNNTSYLSGWGHKGNIKKNVSNLPLARIIFNRS
jgi:hypothetical protein